MSSLSQQGRKIIYLTIKLVFSSSLVFVDTVLLGIQSVRKNKVYAKKFLLALCYVTVLLLDGDIPKTAPAAWIWAVSQKRNKKEMCGLNPSGNGLALL